MDSIKSFALQLSKKKDKIWFLRVSGMIYGFAIGDAIGLQCERLKKETIKELYPHGVIGFNTKKDYTKNGISNGDWTDETDQLILIMETLISTGWKFSRHLFSNSLKKWKENGFYEFGDNIGLGYSSYMGMIINNKDFCVEPHEVARAMYDDIKFPSNDAMPRVPVLSMLKNWNMCIEDATLCTNPDTRCVVSSLIFGEILNTILSPSFDVVAYDEKSLQEIFTRHKNEYIGEKQMVEFVKYEKIYFGDLEVLLNKLEMDIDEKQLHVMTSLGIVIFAYRSVREMLLLSDEISDIYETIVLDILNHGGDTDSNCAMAGAIIGAIIGFGSLPSKWIGSLLYKNWLSMKIINLLS